MTRVGILTGGGDCPGLNAVIRAVVRRGLEDPPVACIGFRHGWGGVLGGDSFPLTRANTVGLLSRGGTILGTSRTNPYADGADGSALVAAKLAELDVDALVAIGGDDTLSVAARLSEAGVPVVGVPKTIDNDLGGTELTFGFHTAVQIATDAIDRLRTTAESHDRVIVCEVMGREAGWIATYAGIAAGADVILVPEWPYDVEEVCKFVFERHSHGTTYSIVVVAEGAVPKGGTASTAGTQTDAFGHPRLGGVAVSLSAAIEERTGFETRYTILGHIQRGGTPTAFDRVLGTRFGVAAMDAVRGGRFGEMVALQAGEIVLLPLAAALQEPKLLDPKLLEIASVFFG
ncbi:MAG TPA: ATP-dependent 6-phosphofructokinase [Solirubrobacteraceae bacterium]|nr:ATP-dependent 6-phosphofructokinase [Solirubrobacteraceae bacterium]